MTINTEMVKAQADVLFKTRNALAEAQQHYDKIRTLNGQVGYGISIGGVSLTVAEMDSRTYMAAMVRGMEMIHLGATKALAARVRALEFRVIEEEKKLTILAGGKP